MDIIAVMAIMDIMGIIGIIGNRAMNDASEDTCRATRKAHMQTETSPHSWSWTPTVSTDMFIVYTEMPFVYRETPSPSVSGKMEFRQPEFGNLNFDNCRTSSGIWTTVELPLQVQ